MNSDRSKRFKKLAGSFRYTIYLLKSEMKGDASG